MHLEIAQSVVVTIMCENDVYDSVDGRNPAPPGMYKTLISTGAGFLPSTVLCEGL